MKRLHLFHMALAMTALLLASCGNDASTNPTPADDLVLNKTVWTAVGFDSYAYRFRWDCFCTGDFTRTVDITVFRGEIVGINDVSTGKALDESLFKNYRTIAGLFDFIQEARDRKADAISATYDPDFGYPSEVYVDYVLGYADEERGFRVFEVRGLR